MEDGYDVRLKCNILKTWNVFKSLCWPSKLYSDDFKSFGLQKKHPPWRIQVMMSYKQNGGLRFFDEKMTEMPLSLYMTHFRSEQTKAKPCLKIPFHPCLQCDIHILLCPLRSDVCLWMDRRCCVTQLFNKLIFCLFASENALQLSVFIMTKGKDENKMNWKKR